MVSALYATITIRNSNKRYRNNNDNVSVPLVENSLFPNPKRLFPRILHDVTETNRWDVIVLINYLFEVSDHVNCYVYSEHDQQMVVAWRGFKIHGSTIASSSSICHYFINSVIKF